MATYTFTTTPRNFRHEAVGGGVSSNKWGTTALGALKDNELSGVRLALDDIMRALNTSNLDSTVNVAVTVTSGSLISVSATL